MLSVKKETGLEKLVQKYELTYCFLFIVAVLAACISCIYIAIG